MEKGTVTQARERALFTLLQQGVHSLPIRTAQLCDKAGIVLRLYEPKDGNEGCCGIRYGIPRIYINKNRNPERRRFTTAHEIGHVFCGHVGKYGPLNRTRFGTGNAIEREADAFATELLMPECVLMALGVTTTAHIMRLCNVSYPAAFYTAKRLERRRAQNERVTAMEQLICTQFGEYISQNRVTNAG